ncbi:hypothetical protein F783_010855 [Bordetella holmesii F627]|nr:hypothetical protein F783_010855 [Bordetella holmesii F627]
MPLNKHGLLRLFAPLAIAARPNRALDYTVN